MDRQRRNQGKGKQRGVSLVIVAGGLVALLAVAGLAIDLASLYVARTEAQRAADAAALAGAQVFWTSSCLSLAGCGSEEGPAAQQAATVGNQNLVGGRNVNISSSPASSCPPPANSACFDLSNPQDPRITVAVQQSMPTFFMRIFGLQTADVSAVATAEAYNPSASGASSASSAGGSPSISLQCAKPWLLPNCNTSAKPVPGPPGPSSWANKNCPSGTTDASGNPQYYPYFLFPNSSPPEIASPSPVGDLLLLKPGQPNQAPVPSQFYPSYFNPNGQTSPNFSCPACATSGGGAQGGGVPSGDLYQTNIECCNLNYVVCGPNVVQPIVGNKVGPTRSGVECLIKEGKNGSGQDILSGSSTLSNGSLVPPLTITGGSNNPVSPNQPDLNNSDSLISVPLYDGSQLCSGMSTCPSLNVDVQGFLQIFIEKVDTGGTTGTVYGYVYNVVGCPPGTTGGGTPSAGGGTITSPGGTTIPIRLIHN
jgi:hypothetical protein